MRRALRAIRHAKPDPAASPFTDIPAFDASNLDGMSDMIGETGVMEIVEIFEADTRRRLRRLEAGGQDTRTLQRELHTLRGAALTVAAPRLNAMGSQFESNANRGIPPASHEIEELDHALDAYLSDFRAWERRRGSTGAI